MLERSKLSALKPVCLPPYFVLPTVPMLALTWSTSSAHLFFFLFAFDFFEITRTQFAILFIACGLVIGAELFNTAIEAVVDLHGKEHTEYGKIAKDCAAGGVLIFTIFAVLCGVAIMYQPTAFKLLFTYFIDNPIAIVLFVISVVVFAIFIFKEKKSNR